jgi:hypothetical protein
LSISVPAATQLATRNADTDIETDQNIAKIATLLDNHREILAHSNKKFSNISLRVQPIAVHAQEYGAGCETHAFVQAMARNRPRLRLG